MTTYRASSTNRLTASWATAHAQEVTWDWSIEARDLAVRARDLVLNSPVGAMMVEAVIGGVLGEDGLRLRSQYQIDGDDSASTAETAIRRQIDRAVTDARTGLGMDAGGQLSAVEIEEQILFSEIVDGDGFAVRVQTQWIDGVRNRWRVIDPARVENPRGKRNSDRLFEGIYLDAAGRPEALSVRRRAIGGHATQHDRIDWYAPDGTPNVVHAASLRRPGSIRGFSWFTPLLAMIGHVDGASEAYVVGKRAQACHPCVIRTTSPAALKAAQEAAATLGDYTEMTPGRVVFADDDAGIDFPQWSYQGDDFAAYIEANMRLFTATWGLPYEYVIAQLTKSNLAASRSALMQFYRTCARYQSRHAARVTQPMDLAAIREGIIRGRILLPDGAPRDPVSLTRGRYQRPPRAMPDPAREATAAEKWAGLGRSLTGIFDEQGWDFRSEGRQLHDDREFLKTIGMAEADEGDDGA